ncbi:MAG: DUF4442 domain-containing protein [Psychrobacter sp.]|nr:DUF4442 domain-containing protein [Psychrobacter sp.]
MRGLIKKLPSKLTQTFAEPSTTSYSAPSSQLKPVNNQFTKILNVTKYLPAGVRASVLSKAFGKVVPFVGTAGIYYEAVAPNQVVVSLNNDKSVQNHIGSIHAVAVTLLAETATGFILGLNLPTDRILLVKSYQVNFYRPLKKGQVAAIATLTDEQRQYILDTPKGDMVIPCVIDDRESDSDRDPITVEMVWAWIPKSELTARRGDKTKTESTQNDSDQDQDQADDITNQTEKS